MRFKVKEHPQNVDSLVIETPDNALPNTRKNERLKKVSVKILFSY